MQITIDMPDSFLKELASGWLDAEQEVKLLLASKLVESGRISTGRAADWVGMSKPRFLREIGRYGVSALPVTPEMLQEDIGHAIGGIS